MTITTAAANKALIAGVGMVKFMKPGTHEPYDIMASNAIKSALADAGIDHGDIQQAFAGYVYGESTCGQRSLYRVGMSGIPVFNVSNNCSSGSSALFLARQAVESGAIDCALAFGFEEMRPAVTTDLWDDRPNPLGHFCDRLSELMHAPDGPMALRLFGAAGTYYVDTYGADPQIFAKVSVKSRRHALNNPYAIFQKPLTVEDVMAAPVVYPPHLTRLMACPPTCGAAAAIVVSAKFARAHGLTNLVEIAGQAMVTDTDAAYNTPLDLIGADMTRRAASQAFETAAVGPEDVDVIELHDCFTTNEVVTYEGLGLCGPGEASRLIEDGDNTYGGKFVVNPSGGLMSKGHPLGATGLAQCTELVWHLRGQAGTRQVDGARIALQHNLGLGGAAVVTIYKNA